MAEDFWHVFKLLVFLCGVSLFVVRVMGNRTVGQFSPFDFIMLVGIGDIMVSTAMDKTISLASGFGGMAALLLLQQVFSFLSLKSNLIRKWVEGTPIVLIAEGKVLTENLRKARVNYDDLRQELHLQGLEMADITDIKLARLESSGDFSIIKISEKEPITRGDLLRLCQEAENDPLSIFGKQMVQWRRMAEQVEEIQKSIQNIEQDIMKKQPKKET
ncbi:MAG: DUF421 domain-containing protein [Selenomonadales bacterium]|jgi:uncharacterized membrane protein YcaP (DUF421 family)|nr:DUF421 domain-containing protein [Selenomonadales bacterium]MBQ5636520.1 DUF421 domain-containing protein [Selenomonadales bacterium]